MQATVRELQVLLEDYVTQVRKLNDADTSVKPSPTKWSKKEILGHLIDSAQNNLRRFIVAQYEDHPTITYRQDDWVRINDYQNQTLENLIQLWYLINQQIVAVLKGMNDETAERKCNTQSLHSLAWLATDYIKHLKHHLHQILALEEIPYP